MQLRNRICQKISRWLFFGFLLLPPAAAEGAEGEITTRIDSKLYFQNRFVLDGEKTRVFVYIEEKPEEQPGIQGGFEGPLFSAGPVTYTGGLKELWDPGAYSSSSNIFSEPAGCKIDMDMDLHSYFGGALQLPKKKFGIGGGYQRKDGSFNGGMWWNVGGESPFRLKGTFLASAAEQPSLIEEPLCLDYSNSLPEDILHISLETLLLTEHFHLSLLGGSSAAKISKTGWFARLRTAFVTRPLELSAAGTYINPLFVTPEGVYPSKTGVLTGNILIFPKFFFHLRGSYRKEFLKPKVFPEMFIGAADSWQTSLEADFSNFQGSFGWKFKQDVNGYGELSGNEAFFGNVSVDMGDCFTIQGGCTYSYDTLKTVVWKFPLELTLRFSPVKMKGKTVLVREETFYTENRLRIETKLGKGALFFSVEGNITGDVRFEDFYAQCGWSLRGAL